MASQATIQQGLGSRRARRGVLGAQAGAGALGWAWQAWRMAGRARGRGARGRQAQVGSRCAGEGSNERAAAGAVGARGARGARGLGAGRVGWPWAVHSVHSACFWPGSTRYFTESNFFGHCS